MFEIGEQDTYDEWKIKQKIEEIVSYDLIADQTKMVNLFMQEETYHGSRPYNILCKNHLAFYFKRFGERILLIDSCLFWCPSIAVVKSKETMREDLKNSSIIREIAVKILDRKANASRTKKMV